MIGMKEYPNNYFDLAVVDPPYGINDTWSKNRLDRFYKQGKLYSYQNKDIPEESYFTEIKRVSKNQIIFGGNYYSNLTSTNSWIIWWKHRNPESHMSEAELAWTSFKKQMRVAQFQWNGAVKCERVEKIHPHQKPVKLYEWIFKNYAKEGQKILDTHLGSGSSRIAAYNYKMDFTGYEIDKDYFEAAEKRFQNHVAQLIIDYAILQH